jgi:hypothetical protein
MREQWTKKLFRIAAGCIRIEVLTRTNRSFGHENDFSSVMSTFVADLIGLPY